MKTKAKLILAMSVLTAGVVAAGATGTFAWFTTNRAAQLNYTSVTAMKNAGNLQVWMAGENATGAAWGSAVEAKVGKNESMAHADVTASTQMSDVSSEDGVSFQKPIWKTVAGFEQEIDRIDPAKRAVDYSVFYFKVTNNGNNKLGVFLNNSTAIKASTPSNTNDEAAAKFTRFAINPAAKDGTNDYPAITPAVTSGTKTILVENDNNSAASDGKVLNPTGDPLKATVRDVDSAKANLFKLGGTVTSDDLLAVSSISKPVTQKLCELEASASAYFYVSVWLEGTKGDGQAFDDAAGGHVNILLDLTGVELTAAGA